MEQVNAKLYNWASLLEPEALRQAERTARLSVVRQVALMPDAHYGMGATVGSVIATDDVVIPAAVGVDIGCGMIAAQLSIDASDLPDDITPFLDKLPSIVPAGVGQGHGPLTSAKVTPREKVWLSQLFPKAAFNDAKLLDTAAVQLGSLGGGNHFFEVCLDENDGVWIVLHSGSRGVGNKLGHAHIKVAKQLAKANSLKLEDQDLAYLEGGTPEFDSYIYDMLWAQDYARINREVMMDAALHEFHNFVYGVDAPDGAWGSDAITLQRINCHHNFTQREVFDGREVWVTRKGAIKADAGDYGIIPGSMGARTYIVRGLGNPLSFNSCSHGAGRTMSRTAAKKELHWSDEDMAGITWNADLSGDREENMKALLDEHPDSYKDIDQVMADQQDLVYPIAQLHQILNYKGTR